MPGAKVFDLPRLDQMAEMLRRDVDYVCTLWREDVEQNAGKQAILVEHPDFLRSLDSANERIDFHALRHTCGAWLALAGVHVKTIQSVMRHKDVTLTLDTYGHLFRSMEAEAVALMGLMIMGVTPESLAIVGTDIQSERAKAV